MGEGEGGEERAQGLGEGQGQSIGRYLICMLTYFRTFDFCHFFNLANIEKIKCQKIKSHISFFNFLFISILIFDFLIFF